MRALRRGGSALPGLPGSLLAVLGLLGAGCAEGDPPAFLQVHLPAQVTAADETAPLLARVRDDRKVVGVTAVVLDADAQRSPALIDSDGEEAEEHRQRIALSDRDDDIWEASLPVPAAGDLVFFLVAEDDDGLRSESRGRASAEQMEAAGAGGAWRRLYLVPVIRGDGSCGPGLPLCPAGTTCQSGRCRPALCGGVACKESQRCHQGTQVCLAATHCIFPEHACSSGTECDWKTGSCVPSGPCAGITCPPGEVCSRDLGHCVSPEHCVFLPTGCPAGQICDLSTGHCLEDDACLGVRCPPLQHCDLRTGKCVFTPGELCAPCDTHTDCSGDDSYCVLYSHEQKACGRDCRSDGICPAGFICQSFGTSGSRRQCIHRSGSCDPADW